MSARTLLSLLFVFIIASDSSGQALAQVNAGRVAHVGVSTTVSEDAEADAGRFLRWTYKDPVDWLGSWSLRRLAYVAGYGVAMVPMSAFDESLDVVVGNWNSGPILDVANFMGDYLAVTGAVGVFGASLLTPDTKFQDAAFTSIQAVAYAGLLTYAIKLSVGRARPEADLGAYHFEPFSGDNLSFPSGHTTTAFAMFSTWAFFYPSVWTYCLFGVASATGLARMVRRKHWLTDVLGGAGVGTATAFWLSRKHQGREDRFTVIPIIGPGFATVSFTLDIGP